MVQSANTTDFVKPKKFWRGFGRREDFLDLAMCHLAEKS
jgi:hypothetical protein